MPVVDPSETFIHLDGDGTATEVPVGPDFWQTIGQRTDLHDGRLLTGGFTSADFPHWEMHPEGEELILASSGAFTLIVEGGETTPIAAGQIAIVPKGTWHRLTVQEPGQTVFVTPGKGTQHKPLAVSQAEQSE